MISILSSNFVLQYCEWKCLVLTISVAFSSCTFSHFFSANSPVEGNPYVNEQSFLNIPACHLETSTELRF